MNEKSAVSAERFTGEVSYHNMGAPEAREEAPIGVAVSIHDEVLAKLEATVEELARRLTPVLVPAHLEPSGEKLAEVRKMPSPLQEQVQGFTGRVEWVRNALSDLIDRLEV